MFSSMVSYQKHVHSDVVGFGRNLAMIETFPFRNAAYTQRYRDAYIISSSCGQKNVRSNDCKIDIK